MSSPSSYYDYYYLLLFIIIYYSDDDDNIVDLTAESPPRKRGKSCEKGNKDLKQSKIVMHTTQVGSQKSTSFTPADKVNITTIEKQNIKNVNCNNGVSFGSNNNFSSSSISGITNNVGKNNGNDNSKTTNNTNCHNKTTTSSGILTKSLGPPKNKYSHARYKKEKEEKEKKQREAERKEAEAKGIYIIEEETKSEKVFECESKTEDFVQNRPHYSNDLILAVVKDVRKLMSSINPETGREFTASKALEVLRTRVKGIESITKSMICKWTKRVDDGEFKKRGPKVCAEFREEVLKRVWIDLCRDVHKPLQAAVTDKEKNQIVLNVCYSYGAIRNSAELVCDRWFRIKHEKYDEVSHLEFSNQWISDFLKEFGLHRSRVTATNKDPIRPDAREVREYLSKIIMWCNDNEDQENFSAKCVINADETAIFWAKALTYIYKTTMEKRGVDGGDDKLRFTAMIWASAFGITGPPFIIVSCAGKSNLDLSNTRVLDSLCNDLNDGDPDQPWTKVLWEKELEFFNKKTSKLEKKLVKRQYLLNRVNGTVVSCQNKAWMDCIGLILWGDVQLKNYKEDVLRNGPLLLLWDNCPPHTAKIVSDYFKEILGIDILLLPKNMTDLLQVIDLIINAPLKADQRRQRIMFILQHLESFMEAVAQFDSYLEECNAIRARGEEVTNHQTLQDWCVPTIPLSEGIRSLIKSIFGRLRESDFVETVADAFVKVGMWRKEGGGFNSYNDTRFSEWIKRPKDLTDGDNINTNGEQICMPNEIYSLLEINNKDGDSEKATAAELEDEEYNDLLFDKPAGWITVAPAPTATAPTATAPTANNEAAVEENVPRESLKEYTTAETKMITEKANVIKLLRQRGVEFDENFGISPLRKLLADWKRTNNNNANNNNADNNDGNNGNAPSTWCFCDMLEEDYDETNDNDALMIECDNPTCKRKWFHYSCLDKPVDWQPPNSYICKPCERLSRK